MKLLLTITSILLSLQVYAQDQKEDNSKLASKELNRILINREFAKIAGGGSESNLGQYASFSTDKDILNLSVYLRKQRDLWKLNVSAGTKDGVASVFSGGEFNKNVTIGVDYAFRLNGNTDVIINWLDKNDYLQKIDEAEKKAEATEKAEKSNRDASYEISKTKRDDDLKNAQNLSLSERNTEIVKIKEVYNAAIAKTFATYLNKTNAVNEEVKKLKGEVPSISTTYVNTSLLKLSGSAGYNDVNLFNGSVALAKQLMSERYIVPKFGLSYHYMYSSKASRFKENPRYNYFNGGMDVSWDTNLASLKKITVRDTENVSDTRSTFSESVAFQGNFKEGMLTSKLFTEYYHFFDQKVPIGIHGIIAHTMIEDIKPVSSLRLGTIFILKNKVEDKKKPTVTFEIFYGINDLFKNQDNQSLFRKNIVGIQTSFPISVKN